MSMTPNERKSFYLGALWSAPYLVGIVYIARHIQSDSVLRVEDRTFLMCIAAKRYMAVCGRDLFLDL